MEMCLNPEKRGEPSDLLTKLEVKFVKNLIEEFLEILDSKVFSDHEDSQLGGSEQVDNSCVLYYERFMEFLIDLLSQLPIRRFLRPVVADVTDVPKGRLFAQLVDLLQLYEGFEINDHSGSSYLMKMCLFLITLALKISSY